MHADRMPHTADEDDAVTLRNVNQLEGLITMRIHSLPRLRLKRWTEIEIFVILLMQYQIHMKTKAAS